MRLSALSVIAALGLTLALPTLGGCSGCGADEGDDEQAEPGSQKATGGESAGGSAGASDETADPGPPPTVRVATEPAEIERGFVPVVQSRGDEAAKLAREVTVERKDDDEWSKVATVSLRFSCDEAPEDECVTLVPGAELRPPPWHGTKGDGAQCKDAEGDPAPPGTYRFVAKSCDGAHRLPGEPFER